MTENKAVSLRIHLKNLNALYQSYMPYLLQGGLFFPSQKLLPLGTVVNVECQLPNDLQALNIKGKVVWMNPTSSTNQGPAGFGVEFDKEKGPQVRATIEHLLKEKLC